MDALDGAITSTELIRYSVGHNNVSSYIEQESTLKVEVRRVPIKCLVYKASVDDITKMKQVTSNITLTSKILGSNGTYEPDHQ